MKKARGGLFVAVSLTALAAAGAAFADADAPIVTNRDSALQAPAAAPPPAGDPPAPVSTGAAPAPADTPAAQPAPTSPPPATPGAPAAPGSPTTRPYSRAPTLPGQTQGRRDINPYDRDIDLTVALAFNRRPLGELPVRLTRDDRLLVFTAGFIDLINPLLNEEGRRRVAETLQGRETFDPETIAPAGVSLEYDPNTLSVVVLRISADLREAETLFQRSGPEQRGLEPLPFSAYLNANMLLSRRESRGDIDTPGFLLNGAIRWNALVFEAEGSGGETGVGGDYLVQRRYARFVYDQPDAYRRWYVGDLDPEIRGRQGFVQLGGIGVSRERRRFDSYGSNRVFSDRRLLLERDSTVRILRNGVLFREIRLDAGSYDISALPLQTGSNAVEIEIRDDAGQLRRVSYSSYLDPIDLDPGDYEYGAFLGVRSTNLFGSPSYGDDVAFTGFYRKAFLDRPAIGVGLQASSEVQVLDGQTQYILPNGARLQLNGSVSNSNRAGSGYAFAVSYDQLIDSFNTLDGVSLQLDYVSESYATLGNPEGDNEVGLTASAQYTHAFSPYLNATADAVYRQRRTGGDEYRVGVNAAWRLNREWSVRGGVDYGQTGGSALFGRQDGFGFTFGIVWQPRYDRRGEARYDSRTNSALVAYNQAGENRVGSLGYSLLATSEDNGKSLSGFADYTANRFDASFSHTIFGRDFESIADEQVTTLRVGTSLAYAGGRFGLGRRIGNSFAVLYPHENLDGRRVIVGDTLQRGSYIARSGPLGGALANFLSPYVTQSLLYDVEDVPQGYDIGPGIYRLRPWYRSGYAFEVGTSDFVSAVGTLIGREDRPVRLLGGRIEAVNATDWTAQPFFTNSAGRFAVQSLRPGVRYRVTLLSDPAASFEFEVPTDNDGLLNLNTISVPVTVEEEVRR